MPAKNKNLIPLGALNLTEMQLEQLKRGMPPALSVDQLFKLGAYIPPSVEGPKSESSMLPELRERFFAWLDAASLNAPPDKVKAFNVCLYEGIDSFEADFFGCPTYHAESSDWACKWCYEAKERFQFSSDDIPSEWEAGLRIAKRWLKDYLQSGRAGAERIKKVGTATVGFADGDIHVVWPQKKRRPTRRHSRR
jgi:hypothetical protein